MAAPSVDTAGWDCVGVSASGDQSPATHSGSVLHPCHSRVTHARNQADTGGHRRTRRRSSSSTGGTLRIPQDTRGHGIRSVRDRASKGGRGPDSQADSQLSEWQRMTAYDRGFNNAWLELRWTVVDARERARGLQNRLRGAVEASWVGSIPIHPRHDPAVVTAKKLPIGALLVSGTNADLLISHAGRCNSHGGSSTRPMKRGFPPPARLRSSHGRRPL